MVPFSLIRQVSSDLEALRSSGMLLFDTRDRGNYGPYNLENTWALLEKSDPTGVAGGLLLAEMIEATLQLSNVKLPRVLLEDGFIAKLQALLTLRNTVEEVVASPRKELLIRLEEGLNAISPTFGEISHRELAIVLRDAIYSMAPPCGLTMRWVEANKGYPVLSAVPLALAVERHDSLPGLLDALRHDRPYGAYLAVVGPRSQTVIALKQPCGIAYLSSLSIDTQTGKLKESRAHNSHMAEKLDLDTMMERYPEWHNLRKKPEGSLPVTSQGIPPLLLTDLPRDNVLWFALVVEMARQQMARLDEEPFPALTEAMTNALPKAGGLPMVHRNWTLRTPTLAEIADSLALPSWVMAHCKEQLYSLKPETFLPQGDAPVGFNPSTQEYTPWKDSFSYWDYPGGYEGFRAHHVQFCCVSPELVGTQDELEAARKAILRKNMAAFIQHVINDQVTRFWLERGFAWFK